MSGGEQQMLAIGRALMARPKLLLLDEPSMGISPILTERIYETIAEINKQGTTILLVEQNANFALGVSHRGYVLETGKVALIERVGQAPRGPRGPARRTWERMTVLAVIGVTALYLLFGWLAITIVVPVPVRAQGLRRALGPGDRAASSRRGVIVWLFVPAPSPSRTGRSSARSAASRSTLEDDGRPGRRARARRRPGRPAGLLARRVASSASSTSGCRKAYPSSCARRGTMFTPVRTIWLISP